MYLAIYGSRWRQWTLHEIASLLAMLTADRLDLPFAEAIRVSEMSILGDALLGTRYPVTLRLAVESEKISQTGDESTFRSTIVGVEYRCAGTLLHTEREKRIAFGLMLHGRWREADPVPILGGGELKPIEFTFIPEEPGPYTDFAIVGGLSTLASSWFNEQTVDGRGVRRLHPGALTPPPYPPTGEDYRSDQLPLWRFVIRPSRGAAGANNVPVA